MSDFPGDAVGKNPPANAGGTGSIPGPGRLHRCRPADPNGMTTEPGKRCKSCEGQERRPMRLQQDRAERWGLSHKEEKPPLITVEEVKQNKQWMTHPENKQTHNLRKLFKLKVLCLLTSVFLQSTCIAFAVKKRL